MDKNEALNSGKEIWNEWAKGQDPNEGVTFDRSSTMPGELNGYIFPFPVNFKSVNFSDSFVVKGAFFKEPVGFHNCGGSNIFIRDSEFLAGFVVSGGWSFTKNEIYNCRFRGNIYAESEVHGITVFIKCDFDGGWTMGNARFFGDLYATSCNFRGRVNLSGTDMIGGAFRLCEMRSDFRADHANIRGDVDFYGTTFKRIPSFSGITGAEYMDLSRANIRPPGTYKVLGVWTVDVDSLHRVRRLKKFAADSHSTDLERDMVLMEREVQRAVDFKAGREKWPRAISNTIFLFLYKVFSNYGKSILLPLVMGSIAHGLAYWAYSAMAKCTAGPAQCSDALWTVTLGSALPTWGTARAAFREGIAVLFGASLPPPVAHAVSLAQGVLTAVFLFLALLAIRNRFRVS